MTPSERANLFAWLDRALAVGWSVLPRDQNETGRAHQVWVGDRQGGRCVAECDSAGSAVEIVQMRAAARAMLDELRRLEAQAPQPKRRTKKDKAAVSPPVAAGVAEKAQETAVAAIQTNGQPEQSHPFTPAPIAAALAGLDVGRPAVVPPKPPEA